MGNAVVAARPWREPRESSRCSGSVTVPHRLMTNAATLGPGNGSAGGSGQQLSSWGGIIKFLSNFDTGEVAERLKAAVC
jgi:hypothetical protein